MKAALLLIAALVGAVVGLVASGLWWTVRDNSYGCAGACADKDLPPGDITLLVGTVGGGVAAVSLLVLTFALRLALQR